METRLEVAIEEYGVGTFDIRSGRQELAGSEVGTDDRDSEWYSACQDYNFCTKSECPGSIMATWSARTRCSATISPPLIVRESTC